MIKENYVMILGANSDIAKELAIYFAKEGFNLYLASRNIKSLENLKNFVKSKYNIQVKILEFDACNFKTHAKFYKNLKIKPLGTIISFGYLGNQIKAQENFEESKKIFDTNFLGASNILEIISKDLEKKKKGFIIAISSVAGDRGRKSNYFYGASKGAFNIYLQGLTSRLSKSKINVLTVKPGFVDTKMTKHLNLNKKLTAKPKEVAKDIYNANKKRKKIIYTRWFWRPIMFLIKFFPRNI